MAKPFYMEGFFLLSPFFLVRKTCGRPPQGVFPGERGRLGAGGEKTSKTYHDFTTDIPTIHYAVRDSVFC